MDIKTGEVYECDENGVLYCCESFVKKTGEVYTTRTKAPQDAAIVTD